MTEPQFVSSRENPLIKELQKLARDNTAYRAMGRVWIEGDHLCGAAVLRGMLPEVAVYAQSAWPEVSKRWRTLATRHVVLPDALFAGLSMLESPSRMGFVLRVPATSAVPAEVASVILDRVQDAGNVGSILRSAAAFGFRQVLTMRASAALWSPKALRAGMGAHFGLQLMEGLAPEALDDWPVPLVVTSSHEGAFIQDVKLPVPCAWVFGHEGQGVGDALAARASHFVRISQPGGEESLNVAAAAAICLHASSLGVPK